jgi:hypothetical protein
VTQPELPSESLVLDIVRESIGTAADIQIGRWRVDAGAYVVVSVMTEPPGLPLIVKLEMPGRVRDHHFQSVAAVARLVRTKTPVPTFDVVACDVSRSKWPWNVLIVTELSGNTWAELYPHLSPAERATGQRQIGRAAAQLHALGFAHFGRIESDGSVVSHGGALNALQLRAMQRIKTPERRDLMIRVLEHYAAEFVGVQQA